MLIRTSNFCLILITKIPLVPLVSCSRSTYGKIWMSYLFHYHSQIMCTNTWVFHTNSIPSRPEDFADSESLKIILTKVLLISHHISFSYPFSTFFTSTKTFYLDPHLHKTTQFKILSIGKRLSQQHLAKDYCAKGPFSLYITKVYIKPLTKFSGTTNNGQEWEKREVGDSAYGSSTLLKLSFFLEKSAFIRRKSMSFTNGFSPFYAHIDK